MTSPKLPEWPERPHDAYATAGEWLDYNTGLTRAALARMEALGEYAQHAPSCGIGGTVGGKVNGCDCGLSELLAACERSKT